LSDQLFSDPVLKLEICRDNAYYPAMRTMIERTEAGKILLPEQLSRLGLGPRRLLRVVLETVDSEDEEISITEMNAQGGAFDYLADEPNLYDDTDLIERNASFGG
jgi:hypothetical protein